LTQCCSVGNIVVSEEEDASVLGIEGN